jgi:hypothetical protein
MRAAPIVCAGLATMVVRAEAQTALRGRVVAEENGQPVVGARLQSLRWRAVAETDRHGRFVLWIEGLPDTVVARFIGRVPDTLAVDSAASGGELMFRLRPSPLPIAGVAVHGDSGARIVDAFPSRWSLPREAMAAVAGAVESDVLRSLVLSPAVAYATPFTAQPFVRGADAGAVGYRLDGFTLLNPFHLGRVFSALMPHAMQSAAVAAAPFAEEWGDATSAVIDAQLRDGGPEVSGGAQASMISAAAWVGGPMGGSRWFLAWRHGFLEHLGPPFNEAPYRFNDVYGRLLLGRPLPAQVTLFWSGDRLFNKEGDQGVRWGNRLVGVRLPFTVGSSTLLEGWVESSSFDQDNVNVPILRGETDVRNVLSTSAAGVRAQWIGRVLSGALGAEARHRRLSNRIAGGTHTAPSAETAGWVGAVFGGLDYAAGRLTAHAGLRLDQDRIVSVLQPRGRIGLELGAGWTLAAAAGRTARLYHVLPDVQPELDVAVYDLWRPAGRAGTPTPVQDHAIVEVKRSLGTGAALRTAVFYSSLRGVGEVRPDVQDTGSAPFFRFGNGRVGGVETEVSFGGARRSLNLAYVLGWSRRTWEGALGEIPWKHDRRHQARAFFAWGIGRGWHLNWLAELASPEPVTPALGAFWPRDLSPSPVGGPSGVRNAVIELGAENSARGGWVGHVDLGIQKELGGPGRSTGRLGISILNLSFTRVVPVVAHVEDGYLTYKALYFLPPIPTFTFRLDF